MKKCIEMFYNKRACALTTAFVAGIATSAICLGVKAIIRKKKRCAICGIRINLLPTYKACVHCAEIARDSVNYDGDYETISDWMNNDDYDYEEDTNDTTDNLVYKEDLEKFDNITADACNYILDTIDEIEDTLGDVDDTLKKQNKKIKKLNRKLNNLSRKPSSEGDHE